MDRNLQECLQGTESGKYILPFFWQHGEPQEILLEEIEAMERANIREFCVESRPYEAFGRESWWNDFGFMLREAEKRGMRVWLLDDQHFPSGYANGYVKDHPECRKTLARMEYRDFVGPRTHMKLIVPEAEAYGANCIWMNGTVIIPMGYPTVKAQIEKAGYPIIEVDTSEFRKIDGGLSCLSLRF